MNAGQREFDRSALQDQYERNMGVLQQYPQDDAERHLVGNMFNLELVHANLSGNAAPLVERVSAFNEMCPINLEVILCDQGFAIQSSQGVYVVDVGGDWQG